MKPDPGHGGMYIHRASKLKLTPGEDSVFEAVSKIVTALREEQEEAGKKPGVTWKDIEKEVCFRLARFCAKQ